MFCACPVMCTSRSLIACSVMDARERVIRLAHTHSLVDKDIEHDYWAEPQASVNKDFTRILFTSNWGRSGTEGVETYMLVLPAGLTGISET